ncbi:MAG: Hsp20/alpha crystallin family protein [Candidatus Binatia bacterium]
MELVRWEPFEGLTRVQSGINDLLEEAFGRSGQPQAAPSTNWYPAVDVLESKDAYIIRAELPGMKKEDFNLELKDGVLAVSGERKIKDPANGVEYHRIERPTGKFFRSFYLPQTVNQDAVKATYRDGILEVHVPKADEAKPRQIAVSLN